ncbi:MAG: hypothetical protein ABI237_05985 [Ginsengibacter sp.]
MENKKCNNCSHEWEIYHVVPVNDTKEHTSNYTCPCKPVIENHGPNMVAVHNSYDGREGVEWFHEVLLDK